MTELGQMLRDAREAQGISLAHAEEATRIRRKYLQALEEANYGILPPSVYVRGFIRNYAVYLGLDPQVALAAYHNGVPGTADPPEPHIISEPLTPGPRVNWELVAGVVMLMLLGVVLYIVYREYILPLGAGAAVPPSLSGLANPDPTSTATLPAAVVGDPLPTPTVEPTATAAPTATAEPPTDVPPTDVPPTATLTLEPTATHTATPQRAQELTLTLDVSALSWTRVVTDGETVYEGTLEPGDAPSWTAQREIAIRTGNAGGLRATVNDRDMGVLGAAGQVRDYIWQLAADGEVVVVTPTP
jgi:cytoskeleton protein RodZ